MAAVGRYRRYVPDTTSQGFLLGTGGCSSQVERYCQQGTQKAVAVKRVPKADIEALAGLFDNEVAALTAANAFGIIRVSTFVEEAFCENGDRCLVLKLVEGGNLYDHMSSLDSCTPVGKEEQVLVVAAQLLDTLFQLHVAKWCHLDVSPGNVMLQWHSDHPWDTLRLVDFGFAKQFEAGDLTDDFDVCIRDVKPDGATMPYASPEQLRSLKIQWGGADLYDELLIDGHASDMFSAGVVLYEALTGELPFRPRASRDQPSTAESTAADSSSADSSEQIEIALNAHEILADSAQEDAVIAAMDADEPVKHPLLDKIRDCSANPDAAADFFLQILHPYPSTRMSADAFNHPYVAETCAEMEAYCKDAPVTTPTPYSLSVLKEDVRADTQGYSHSVSGSMCLNGQAQQSEPQHVTGFAAFEARRSGLPLQRPTTLSAKQKTTQRATKLLNIFRRPGRSAEADQGSRGIAEPDTAGLLRTSASEVAKQGFRPSQAKCKSPSSLQHALSQGVSVSAVRVTEQSQAEQTPLGAGIMSVDDSESAGVQPAFKQEAQGQDQTAQTSNRDQTGAIWTESAPIQAPKPCPEAAQNLDQAVTLDPIQAPSLGTAWSPPHAGFHPASLSGLAVLPLRLKVSLQLSSQAKPVEPLSCFPLLWAGPIQASRQGPFRLLIRTQATSILRPSFGQTQNCTQASCGGAFRVYYSAASHSGSAQVKLWLPLTGYSCHSLSERRKDAVWDVLSEMPVAASSAAVCSAILGLSTLAAAGSPCSIVLGSKGARQPCWIIRGHSQCRAATAAFLPRTIAVFDKASVDQANSMSTAQC
ncbi:hypothetical protein WJX82_001356 [Trebouxia sp. C0006]